MRLIFADACKSFGEGMGIGNTEKIKGATPVAPCEELGNRLFRGDTLSLPAAGRNRGRDTDPAAALIGRGELVLRFAETARETELDPIASA